MELHSFHLDILMKKQIPVIIVFIAIVAQYHGYQASMLLGFNVIMLCYEMCIMHCVIIKRSWNQFTND